MAGPTKGGMSRRPRWPELQKRRRELAEAGRVDEIWRLIQEAPWSMVSQEENFGLLLRAIAVRCESDPQGFAQEMYGRMVAMVSYITLRTHHHLNARLGQHGHAPPPRPAGDLPRDVVDTILPRLQTIHEHLNTLLQGQAATARAWELARAKKYKNEQVTRDGPSKARRHRRADTVPAGPAASSEANGKHLNRITEFLGNSKSRADGAEHDG